MRKTTKYLAHLVGAATLVLAMTGSAQAHGRFFFGLTIAPPFPPVAVYPAPPVYVAPPAPYSYYYDHGVYYERHYDPYTGRYYFVPRYNGPYYRGHFRDHDADDY
jgi:hypothetical protein